MVAKRRKSKNPHAVALGKKGGKVSSPAKTAANRANARTRWKRVRDKALQHPDKQVRAVARRAVKLMETFKRLEGHGPIRFAGDEAE